MALFSFTSCVRTHQVMPVRLDEGSRRMLRSPDATFAIEATQSSSGQIEFGKLATEKASDAEVKTFAHQVVNDQTRVKTELTAMAHAGDMTLPASLTASDRAELLKLRRVNGASFDRGYIDAVIASHTAGAKAFKQEVKKGSDSRIQQFASASAPMLEQHLAQAKELKAKLPHGSSSH